MKNPAIKPAQTLTKAFQVLTGEVNFPILLALHCLFGYDLSYMNL
jgi:hypothetical protein